MRSAGYCLWFCSVALCLSLPFSAQAQNRARVRMPPQFVAIEAGLGLSSPYSDDMSTGEGFYAQGEYVLVPSAWFSPRAYAGTLFTFSSPDDYCREHDIHCEVSAKIGFLGAKGRLTIPIPYIAPFIELGIGASIGAMRTRTPSTNESLAGITYHIPLGIGLSVGKDHNWDVAFSYLFHPTEKRFDGAFAIGFSFQVAGPRPSHAPD